MSGGSCMRMLTVIITISIICLCGTAAGANLTQSEISEIRQAASQLVSSDTAVKQQAAMVLDKYGISAIPHYVELIGANRNENNFIAFELVNYIEKYEEAGLPVIKQALSDPNPLARIRAARIASFWQEKAEPIIPELTALVADINESREVRMQAIDTLSAIGMVNQDIIRALAMSLTGDGTLTWRTFQAINTLKIGYEDLMPILFEELSGEQNTYHIITAITHNLNRTTDPVGILAEAFKQPTDELTNYLFTLIDGLFPAMLPHTGEIVDMLFAAAKEHPEMLEQALYSLSELAIHDENIVFGLLDLVADETVNSDTYLMLVYALERTPIDNPLVVEFFVNLLISGEVEEKARLAAARYLEKCGKHAFTYIPVLLDSLDTLSEPVLWRLSPLFYRAAQADSAVLDQFWQLVALEDSELLQNYAYLLLSSLGEPVEENELLEIVVADFAFDQVPAFPGAEGYGRYTVGGRGGDVYVVTNLNERGPGSLREAVQASGPRTVVFTVSGNIMLTEALNIDNPYITIAGQTAPGDGITIIGAPTNINTDQVIIRYMRFRLGDYNNHEDDSIGGRYISDIMLDHISASWAVDETVSFYVCDNLTLQWSFITESLRGSLHVKGNHGYGGIWGGAASYHHNLLAHHSSRTPRFDGERNLSDPAVDMRNNVIYNWGFNNVYGGEGANHNIIANYYKAGPGTGMGMVRQRIVEVSNGGQWYVDGNYVHGYPEISADNWSGGVQPRLDRIEDIKSDTEFPVPYVTTHTAEHAYELVLADAGTTLPVRDQIDQRIVREVRDGTATYGGVTTGLQSGIIDSQEDVGGLQFLRSFSASLDSDGSGIPDWWLIKHGFSPESGLDPAGDIDGDGYTNLEEYLNGTNPRRADKH